MHNHLQRFIQDAGRWVVQGQIATPQELSAGRIVLLLYRYLSLRALAWFRLGSWLKDRRVPVLPPMIQRLIHRHYGLEILVGADIGGGLYIAHPTGCVIVPATMGENCSVIAAVTIGMRNEPVFPKIGDRVFIGAGVRVLGDILIGDDARIGANAVVITDLPAGVTAVGAPARPVLRTPSGDAMSVQFETSSLITLQKNRS